MRIVIEAHDLPGRFCGPGPDYPDGHHNIHVGLQRRNRPDDLDGVIRGDTATARWVLDCEARNTPDGVDVTGPFIQGRRGNRFIYLSWGTVDDDGFHMFRRAKLVLNGVPADVLADAVESGGLQVRVGLSDHKGNPACADLRRSGIEWTALGNH